MARAYDNTQRARKAGLTAERIVDATEQLVTTGSLAELTLQAIADLAGVTVQTVLRHMGSRDGCLAALRERVAARIDRERGETPAGDVAAALSDLLAHYEAEGRLILNLLSQASDDWAREATEDGRAYHRAWVLRCFGPLLGKADETSIDALVAATDLYVWKLVRLDLGRSPPATAQVFDRLVRATLEASCKPS